MSSIKLSDEELDLLAGATDRMFRLYITARRQMDYATGKAGERDSLVWASLNVDMNVDAHTGIPKGESGRPGTDKLQRAGNRLVKRGLLKNLSVTKAKRTRLIFSFPFAQRDQSARNQPTPQPTPQPTCTATPVITNNNEDLDVAENANPPTNPPTNPRSYPVKIKSTNKNKQKKSTPAALDYSSWPAIPSQQIMDDWLAMRKAKRAQVSQTVVTRFGKQLQLAGMAGHSVDDCLGECIERNWLGFKAEWITNQENRNSWNGGKKLSAVEQALEDLEGTPSEDDGDTIDGEALH